MHLLFVCMGNICRSPAAEAIFRHLVDANDLSASFHIDSAGTIGYHEGERADARMRASAADRGYVISSLARQVRPSDFEIFDLILAMDQDNMECLLAQSSQRNGRAEIRLMCDFATRHAVREVPDPYYGGPAGFEKVLDLLEDACAGLLEELRNRAKPAQSR